MHKIRNEILLFQFTEKSTRKVEKCNNSTKRKKKTIVHKFENPFSDNHMRNDVSKFESSRLNCVDRIEKTYNYTTI